MLTLLIGTDWKANREAVLSSISQDVVNRKAERLLIVPELISHDSERRLAAAAGDTASRYAEVLTFSRMARRISKESSLGLEDCLDNGGRIAAMAAAARNVTSKLKSYAGLLSRPEFLSSLVDAVDEFKRCCISSDDLRRAAGKSEGVFAQKLEELALILDAYDAIAANGKRDPRDQMTLLLEHLESMDYAKEHVFYIDGFPDFTRQHMSLIEHFILESPAVTVSLNCDEPGSRNMAFEKAGKTAVDLIRFAKANAVPISVVTIKASKDPIQLVSESIFHGKVERIDALQDRLKLYRAESLHEECMCAAQEILKKVRAGCRYRDIGVVCSDMGEYEDAIRYAFSRCDIPSYRSGTEDVLQRSAISALISALNAALGGFEQKDVLRYMKSVLSPLDEEECDLLENYSILWGVRASRWTKVFENHPDGLGAKWDDASICRLAQIERSRSKLIDPLVMLRDAFGKAAAMNTQLQAICDFFDSIGLPPHMQRLAEEMDELGDNRSAQVLHQLWDILLQAIDQLRDMLGETHWSSEDFTRLLELTLSRYNVGTIPTVLDSVMVGSVSAMRCHQVKHLIIVGAKEGRLPGYNGVSGIFTDREREQLRYLEVPLMGGGMEGLQSSFAEIYAVFNSATESITLICGAEQPSFIYNRLVTIAGGEQKFGGNDRPVATAPFDAAAYLVRLEDKESAAELGLETQFAEIAEKSNYEFGTITPERVSGLYGKCLNLSASQVDKQADCRFSYFLRYGLHAEELKEASVDPAEFGTYFHAVLEQTARRIKDLGGFHKVSLEDTIQIATAYSDQYIQERFSALDSGRISYLFARNVRELQCLIQELWTELSHALFSPECFEIGFGDGKQLPAVDIPGSSMEAKLRGFVDRVDVWRDGEENYFRIVDYKTGKKSFDYCDVFNGMGLQMLIYMFALEQGGEAILGDNPLPAGVQYFSARFPYLKEDCLLSEDEVAEERQKELKRKGLVIASEKVLSAMEPEGAPNRLPVSYDKEGALTGDVADRNQFHMLRKYVFKVLRKLVDEIASGKVSPNPYTRGDSHNACRFCPYGAVCHKETVAGRRNYKAMSAKRFWDEVEKEVHRNG